MIKWFKNDFKGVKESLGYFVGREVPLGIAILWYVTALILVTPLVSLIGLYYRIKMNILVWKYTREA